MNQEHLDHIVAFTQDLQTKVHFGGEELEEFLSNLRSLGVGICGFRMGSYISGQIDISTSSKTVSVGHEYMWTLPEHLWQQSGTWHERKFYWHPDDDGTTSRVVLGFRNIPIFREGQPSLNVQVFVERYLSQVYTLPAP